MTGRGRRWPGLCWRLDGQLRRQRWRGWLAVFAGERRVDGQRGDQRQATDHGVALLTMHVSTHSRASVARKLEIAREALRVGRELDVERARELARLGEASAWSSLTQLCRKARGVRTRLRRRVLNA